MVSTDFAPEVIIGAYNNMAYCYLGKGDLKNAEKCITGHALPVAVKTNNIDWQSTVYDTYADILMQKGNSTEATVYKKKASEAKITFRASVSASLAGTKNK
jgi:predicted negative regulator of RcsB-dependent stress response